MVWSGNFEDGVRVDGSWCFWLGKDGWARMRMRGGLTFVVVLWSLLAAGGDGGKGGRAVSELHG